jgi:hypothetical protein
MIASTFIHRSLLQLTATARPSFGRGCDGLRGRQARSLGRAGGKEISIVASRTHEYGELGAAVIHQVVARSDVIDAHALVRLYTLWVRGCAADHPLTPLW